MKKIFFSVILNLFLISCIKENDLSIRNPDNDTSNDANTNKGKAVGSVKMKQLGSG